MQYLKLWHVLQRVFRMMDERNLSLIAAGVAFYSILAVFPGLATVIAIWGVVGDPAAVAEQVSEFKAVLPQDVFKLIDTQLRALSRADGLTLGWASLVSLVLAIWSARAGVAALMRGLNAIYKVPNRQGFAHYLRALMLTVALIGVAVTAIACVVLVPVIMAFLPLGPWAGLGLDIARWTVALSVLLAGFLIIYRLGPNRADRLTRLVMPGAIFATLCWAAASSGFSIYLKNFGAYNEVYGSIGAVIAMLMWLFISAWLVLLGGALNAELEKRSTRGPSTKAKQ
ncbi:MAG: membrane protein [Ascidiaceihabitans sp.]|jgi:membrane protein